MRTPPRPARAAALVPLIAALALTAGCSGGGPAAPPTPEWPTALTVDADTAAPFWVVWTAVAEQGDTAASTLQPALDQLDEAGYSGQEWDPACVTASEQQLAALTGYADVVGVGVAFASEKDVGAFDTLFEGTVVSVTSGEYTCTA
ncbi:hypothetical protein ACGIF2_13195 [Cellulomonas sp. P22]|uniref:hypothetical protein n=1 Tax=Cellulomonas sp. P22 TaxID=3373189 RepID=UPI00379C60E2